MPGVNKLDSMAWGNVVIQQMNNSLTYEVVAAADAIVGEYTVFVDIGYVNLKGEKAHTRQKLEDKIIILYNAWCPRE